MVDRARRRRAKRLALRQLLPLQLGLVALWLLLWGGFDWLTLLTGLALAIAVPLVFYLPPVEIAGRLHLGWSAWFVLRLLADILRASVIVAAQAFGIGYSERSAVLGVRLRTRSDLILTAVAEATSLVPGSLVVDVDRGSGELFIHVFSVRSDADLVRARAEVLATEARVLLAAGSPIEVARLRKERAKARAARRTERAVKA